MGSETRRRALILCNYGYQSKYYLDPRMPPYPPMSGNLPYVANLTGQQETVSRDNPGWIAMTQLIKRGHWESLRPELRDVIANQDHGWAFQTRRNEYKASSFEGPISKPTYSGAYSWRTPRYPQVAKAIPTSGTSSWWPILSYQSTNFMVAGGTKAINLTLPASPCADVAVAVGELAREGVPHIPGRSVFQALRGRDDFARAIGDEYLTKVFGWDPLIRDIKDVAKSIRKQDELLRAYERNAGRRIKRRWDFEPIVTTERFADVTGQYPAPALPTPVYSGSGTLSRVRTTTRKLWFSGAYKYYVPTGHTMFARSKALMQKSNYLFGTSITPATIWNLTPWSWLADWFANVGDVMTNASVLAYQDVVIAYAYIMCETRTDDEWTLRGNFGNGIPSTLSQTFSTVTKQRLRASPYGFALTWDGFSDQQLAILAALGLTKARSRS